ncbi:MAG: 3-hydroxyacyl-CoA dehydrogenase family protein [Thermaerobacter sp.]|nr:3-hydroxyacyl-CoA dehydrogenase family protein [Thermaerobacter sp.]
MNSAVWLLGADAGHVDGWRDGAEAAIVPLSDAEWDRAARAPWVIDAGFGPLDDKRTRLRALEAMGVKAVFSASATVTVSAQARWLEGDMQIVGCDGLLMAVKGQVQTVANAAEADLAWLKSIWPGRDFVVVDDTVGQVFPREILPIINEAVAFFSQDVAPEDIDRGVRLGLNYPRGPLEWAQLFGWPAVHWGLRALEDMYGPRFRPHPWIRRQVGSSLHGHRLAAWDDVSRS